MDTAHQVLVALRGSPTLRRQVSELLVDEICAAIERRSRRISVMRVSERR